VTQQQDFDAEITWTQDWANHLAANGDLTIASAAATADLEQVTVGTPVVGDDSTSVTFKVTQDGLTAPAVAIITVHVVLSNDDEDERDFSIQFTNT